MSPSPQEPVRLTREVLFEDATAAETLLHTLRWPRGRALCPHCGFRHSYRLTSERTGAIRFKCARCRKQYSARRGTVLERSNVSTGRWLLALWLCLTQPGPGLAGRLQRAIGVSHKTAWAMVHRVGQHPEDPILASLRRERERDGVCLDPCMVGEEAGEDRSLEPVRPAPRSMPLGGPSVLETSP